MAYRDSTGQLVYLDRDAWRHRRDSLRQTRGELATRRSMDTTGRTRPFMLDSLGQVDRDSCIFYAQSLLDACRMQKEQLVRDSTHYAETAALLKSSYDYAQQRYKTVQNRIFIEGQTAYGALLKNFPRYWQQATRDAVDKYSPNAIGDVNSQWRGPMVTGFSLFVLFWLVISVLVSVLLAQFLTRKVPFFKQERIASHRFEMTLILSVVVFALSIMIASWVAKQNFLSMASKLLVEFAWMLAAILVSLVILHPQQPAEHPVPARPADLHPAAGMVPVPLPEVASGLGCLLWLGIPPDPGGHDGRRLVGLRPPRRAASHLVDLPADHPPDDHGGL